MSAIVIAEIDVQDAATFEEYRVKVPPLVEKFGGRYLARGGRAGLLEGENEPKRVVIIEFPSYQQAMAWHDSAEYAPLIALRQSAAKGRMIVVEGV
jgi:uncharacterized protein (DUF1330 family)